MLHFSDDNWHNHANFSLDAVCMGSLVIIVISKKVNKQVHKELKFFSYRVGTTVYRSKKHQNKLE